MGQSTPPNEVRADEGGVTDEGTIAAFASHLDDYARALSERERRALIAILLRAMDPLERMRWRDPASVLDEGEQAILRDLLGEQGAG